MRGWQWAEWLLRVGIFIHALTLWLMVFSRRQTQFGNWLFMELLIEWEDPYLSAVMVEKISASVFLAAALLMLFKPISLVLILMAVYSLGEAVAGTWMAGYRFSEWTVPGHALRWGLPLALIPLIAFRRPGEYPVWRSRLAGWVLRLAVAAVFIAHGAQAYLENPRFIDLILGTSANLFGFRIAESTAVAMLKVICLVDFGVAAAILVVASVKPERAVDGGALSRRFAKWQRLAVWLLCGWLAFWGMVTALSRMTSLGYREGLSEYVEVLIRTPHVLGPLALGCLLSVRRNVASTSDGDPPIDGHLI